ncbi:MAG: sodium:solute symporter [bacterium]
MNLHPIDLLIVAALLAVLCAAALFTRRYVNSVSAFLAADRLGGRYLIALALATAGTGVITLVYWFEIYYQAGYSAYWWSSLTEPALIVIALSGWIVYRFRQTRALTLAQFFEMRYSRNFRVLAGLVAFLSGIINFGIYPSVSTRFFMALCHLPASFPMAGTPWPTFPVLMIALVSVALAFTFLGGQLAVMVTDFIQGVFANIVFLVLIVYLLGFVFRWDQIDHVLRAMPSNESPIHPLHMSGQQDFNLTYFLIAVAIVFYTFNAWQGTSGYNACAKDAHEAKMAGVLYGWRFRVLLIVTIVVPVAVLTLMHHPDFAGQARQVQASLDGIQAPTAEERRTLAGQLRIPYALALLLPPGLLGCVVAAMVGFFISSHETALHSWGSIFVQDVVLPFRKTPFAPRTQLWLLRASILGVGVFAVVFSLLIQPTQFIAMFFAITGAVFVGGAGSAIIGGLYWKRGTAQGAWASMLTGMTLSVIGVVVKQIDPAVLERTAASWPWLGRPALFVKSGLTGQELTFAAMCCSIVAYVAVSLLGPRRVTDMDRLLHRGIHATKEEAAKEASAPPPTWLERLGIDREFTKGDRWVAYVSIGWPFVWTTILLGVTAWNLLVEVPDTWWSEFWRIWTWAVVGAAAAVTVWFAVGGVADLRYLFRALKTYTPDVRDDGRVGR